MNWDTTQDSYVEVVDSVTIRGYRFSDGWARKQKYSSKLVSLFLLRMYKWIRLLF